MLVLKKDSYASGGASKQEMAFHRF